MGQLLYDKASLVNIPSRYKDGKLYNIKPSNADFDFERGTGATRVNEDGLIETFYGEATNLLLQSNQFDTTWTNVGIDTPTNGFAGYDGLSNAWSLVPTSTSTSCRLAQSISTSGVNTFSVYAKANGGNGMTLRHQDSTTGARFDLSNGTLGIKAANVIKHSIEDVGNGWYKCSVTINQTITEMRIYVSDVANSYSCTEGNGILVQDAQLEAGYFATPYIETTTETVTVPNRGDTPRIDYTDSNNPSLLLEPQRTNLITYSEDFGGYTNSNSTDTPNDTTSPEGVNNGTFFKEEATTGQHKLVTPLTFDGSSTYTFSIFAKYNGRDLFIDTQNSNEWQGRAWFDLSLGTANAILGSASIEDYGGGWYRCIVTGDSLLSGSNNVELLTSDGSTNSTTGDTTKGVYIYGAQAEVGSYATSYIPTNGGTETRLADDAFVSNLISNGIITSNQFTFFIELEGLGYSSNKQVYLKDVNGNRILSLNFIVAKNRYGFYSPDVDNYVSSDTADEMVKIAVSYDGSNFKQFFNGVKTGTLAVSVTNLINEIDLSELRANALAINEKLIFPTALSDHELERLTSQTPFESSFEDLANNNGYTIL